jgi:hypothetical protein
MQFNVKSATVLVRAGESDIIMIILELPASWPEIEYETCFKLETAEGRAIKYLMDNFPELSFHVIDTRDRKEYDVASKKIVDGSDLDYE